MLRGLFKITAAIALIGTAAIGAPAIAQTTATANSAPATSQKQGIEVSLADGQASLRVPPDFVNQTSEESNAQNTGVAVQLYANRQRSQVVGISEVRAVKGDAMNTDAAAFDKIAQGALSGLKTQFKDVEKIGQTTLMAAGHKLLRLDTHQEMKGVKMIGTTLVTPYSQRVITIQILTPATATAEHAALVNSVLDSLMFH